jgi:hypothetical protein
MGEEVIGEWGKLHSTELHNFYFSSTIMAIKRQRTGWARCVARMEVINAYKILDGRNHSGDFDVDGKIILKWIVKRMNVVV